MRARRSFSRRRFSLSLAFSNFEWSFGVRRASEQKGGRTLTHKQQHKRQQHTKSNTAVTLRYTSSSSSVRPHLRRPTANKQQARDHHLKESVDFTAAQSEHHHHRQTDRHSQFFLNTLLTSLVTRYNTNPNIDKRHNHTDRQDRQTHTHATNQQDDRGQPEVRERAA